MAMVNQAASPGLSQRPPRAPKLSRLTIRTLMGWYFTGCCAHPIPVRTPRPRGRTPISRRKSVTQKLDMELAQEDVRRDDEERLEELIDTLSSWLTQLLGIPVTSETFLPTLRDGVILCTVANKINAAAVRFKSAHRDSGIKFPAKGISKYHKRCQPYSFHARENITKFVRWAEEFGVGEALLFNSDELITGDGKKIALCLQAIARKTKLFIPTLDFEISKMVAVLRDLGTLLGTDLVKDPRSDSHREKIMDAMISERGFWRGIQQRISDAVKSENSVKRDVNQQDIQMLRMLGISQTSKHKMEVNIEEERREEMVRVLQAAATAKHKHEQEQNRLMEETDEAEGTTEGSISESDDLESTNSDFINDRYGLGEHEVLEVKLRPRYQFVKVKVPAKSKKMPPKDLLSPEMFFFGSNKPAYEELSLDMFMQGYTALLADERVLEQERLGRLKLLQILFMRIIRYSWQAVRQCHLDLTNMVEKGELAWSDDLENTFNMLLEDQRLKDSSSEGTPHSTRSCCSSCGGRTPLKARTTTPLTVVRHVGRPGRHSSVGSCSDYEVELPPLKNKPATVVRKINHERVFLVTSDESNKSSTVCSSPAL